MFNKRKKVTKRIDTNKRTRVTKLGGMVFHKKVRKANAQEKIENKKSRLYYKHNKTKLQRQAKLRALKLKHNPRLLQKQQFKRDVEEYAKRHKVSIPNAIRILKNKQLNKVNKVKVKD